MVRHLLSFAALLAGLAALSFVAAPIVAEDTKVDADKWTPLFNGKDLTGWKMFPKPNPGDIGDILAQKKDGKVVAYNGVMKKGANKGKEAPLWRVEDGILIGSGPHSHLFTERGDFENFRYRVEAKINDHGNSGQYFRTKFTPDFPQGYEAQINSTHGDPIRTGSLYPSFPGVTKADREKILIMERLVKPDEWFTQEVIAQGNHIVIKVNGKTTVDFVDKKNAYKKGHFALQGHDPGTVVKYRKVEVIELPADKKE
ncbi:MAG TPA: DUF1080 domain-containing protein [Gemmataceae bacterium]|nr:DUF1080 domain-containing protein [Gemmataceae bacterium]